MTVLGSQDLPRSNVIDLDPHSRASGPVGAVENQIKKIYCYLENVYKVKQYTVKWYSGRIVWYGTVTKSCKKVCNVDKVAVL